MAKTYQISISKYGNSRYTLVSQEDGRVWHQQSYRTMIEMELARAVLEGQGFIHVERAA